MKPIFPSLAESGHRTLDLRPPTGKRARDAWKKGDPWFPDGPGRAWTDVYRTWFGDGDRPLVNLHLMGNSTPAWDDRIRAAYEPLWREAQGGGLAEWEATPKSCMAKLLLVDQLPRHIFRGKPEAFATDAIALRLVDKLASAIAQGKSGLHLEDAIMMALPWVHQESLDGTYRATWWHASLAEAARGTPYHLRTLFGRYGAERHVRVIQRFGRYPHRNAALGRPSTPEETRHLARDADIWEVQQSATCGTYAYQLRAARFFLRMALYLVASGESHALKAAIL